MQRQLVKYYLEWVRHAMMWSQFDPASMQACASMQIQWVQGYVTCLLAEGHVDSHATSPS